MIVSGFNMKRDITPFVPHEGRRHAIPATITSRAKRIDLLPIRRLQRKLSTTDLFPSQFGGRRCSSAPIFARQRLESMDACRSAGGSLRERRLHLFWARCSGFSIGLTWSFPKSDFHCKGVGLQPMALILDYPGCIVPGPQRAGCKEPSVDDADEPRHDGKSIYVE